MDDTSDGKGTGKGYKIVSIYHVSDFEQSITDLWKGRLISSRAMKKNIEKKQKSLVFKLEIYS